MCSGVRSLSLSLPTSSWVPYKSTKDKRHKSPDHGPDTYTGGVSPKRTHTRKHNLHSLSIVQRFYRPLKDLLVATGPSWASGRGPGQVTPLHHPLLLGHRAFYSKHSWARARIACTQARSRYAGQTTYSTWNWVGRARRAGITRAGVGRRSAPESAGGTWPLHKPTWPVTRRQP